MTRVDRQPGLVLHRRPFRESSLLIEMFTRDSGRVGLVARGARAAKSPLRGLAEPFHLLSVSWTRRGELGTLTGLEPAADARDIPTLTGRAVWCGLYANELILKLVPRDDPEPGLFGHYCALLGHLARPPEQARALRRFELALLAALGVAPDLGREAGSDVPVRENALYRVDPVAGPVVVEMADSGTVRGAVLSALAEDAPMRGADAAAARRVLRGLLDHQLDGRVLHTPRLFREA